MELSKKYESNLESLKEALVTFKESLKTNFSGLNDLGNV